MTSRLAEVAQAHRADRLKLQRRMLKSINAIWSHADVNRLDASWSRFGEAITKEVAAAQILAARAATPYVDATDQFYGRSAPGFTLVPEAFAGVMLDGRELGPALFSAVTTAKTAIGGGSAPPIAFQSGMYALQLIASSALQDMGRQADLTLGRARGYTYYVRVVGGQACSRCAILAGIRSGARAFLRHPSCQCTAALVESRDPNKVPDGFHTSPEAYFQSLSAEQQDKVFTKAGADVIRAGGSPISVVNARRGAYGIGYHGHYNIPVDAGAGHRLQPLTIGVKPDGSPLRVFATTEGTTARGSFGRAEIRANDQAVKDGRYRRTTTIRLMPEQIVKMAGDNEDRLRELLVRYGYGY